MSDYDKDIFEVNARTAKEIKEHNAKILVVPSLVTPSEQPIYKQILNEFSESIKYKLSATDSELIWQYCQLKIMPTTFGEHIVKTPNATCG